MLANRGCCRSWPIVDCPARPDLMMTTSLSRYSAHTVAQKSVIVSALTESELGRCHDQDIAAMMSDANREIRLLEDQAAERRRRTTVRDLIHRLDRLVAELEELNIAGEPKAPDWIVAELDEVEGALPHGASSPAADRGVSHLMERCFELQGQLLMRRQLAS
jgi:hypothetical protein